MDEWDWMDKQDYRQDSIGYTLLSIISLGTKGRDGQPGLKAVLKESIRHPLLPIRPLGTKGRYGQAGLKALLQESIGNTLLSISLLGTKGRNGQAALKALSKSPLPTLYCLLVSYGQRKGIEKQD